VRNEYKISAQNLKRRDYSKCLGAGERMILKCILGKKMRGIGLQLSE
jgi:hypothetical protein